MKLYRYIAIIAAVAISASCSKILNEVKPESGSLLAQQNQETNAAVPTRASASFNGLFNALGLPYYCGYNKPDDWGVLMMLFCNDLESADAFIPDSGYNWFSVCGEYSSRSSNYRNPTIRYKVPYNLISNVNDFLAGFGDDVTDENSLYMIAQAKALRAYAYMLLAPAFQFNYVNHKDDPCVPICTMDTELVPDPANNPRATVGKIYELILQDLNEAVDGLAGYKRSNKMYIDQQVAYGLRARAYLDMGMYAEAAADAAEAMKGYTPASIAEVSVPSFMDINEHNWIWGFDMDAAKANQGIYATSSSWLRSFSGYAYAAACQCYTCINSILYVKIPDTDVRKGWWLNENSYSPLLDGLTWNAGDNGSASGQDIVGFEYDDKLSFIPYTNVKFGCLIIGTTENAEDSPLMRVEEMILLRAEALAKSGNEAEGKKILEDFVKTYRDPSYSVTAGGRNFADEVWFQRRVELWGEGFGIYDTKRLNKPMVRFLGEDGTDGDGNPVILPGITNQPTAFRFNMAADDGWLLMKFADGELNTNFGIKDNTEGELPKTDQNYKLRDGVTD